MINIKLAKRYCKEDITLIENYSEAISDTTQTWTIHHKGEILPCGRYSINDLKKFNLYYHRPASELIFIRSAEHTKLHHLGAKRSNETKQRISNGTKGNKKWLGKHHTEETKHKISQSHIGIPAWNKGKHLSEEHRRKIGIATTKRKGIIIKKDIWEQKDKILKLHASGLSDRKIAKCFKCSTTLIRRILSTT